MYLCTCERVPEKGDFGSCFRGPFHRTQTRRFNLFLGPRRQACFELPDRGSRFRHSPVPSPPFSERPLLGPQALSQKWTSLDLLCGSWLAVYIGCRSHLAFGLPSLLVLRL